MNSDDWDKRYREKKLVWSAGPNQFLVQELASMPVGRALDLACGEGRNAIWLAEQGWKVVASDYSPVAIEKAKARCSKLGLAVELRVADAAAKVDGLFDLVAIFYLHLPREENKAVLRQAVTSLAPGGTLLYLGHDVRNIAEGIGGPQDPTILYGPVEIASLLPTLEIEKAETIRRPVEREGTTHDALDVLVRARCKGN